VLRHYRRPFYTSLSAISAADLWSALSEVASVSVTSIRATTDQRHCVYSALSGVCVKLYKGTGLRVTELYVHCRYLRLVLMTMENEFILTGDVADPLASC
jgi:hypothetical protein